MAGRSREEVDLISVYDCYTITVLMTIEDAGFCPRGEGQPFVREHDLSVQAAISPATPTVDSSASARLDSPAACRTSPRVRAK